MAALADPVVFFSWSLYFLSSSSRAAIFLSTKTAVNYKHSKDTNIPSAHLLERPLEASPRVGASTLGFALPNKRCMIRQNNKQLGTTENKTEPQLVFLKLLKIWPQRISWPHHIQRRMDAAFWLKNTNDSHSTDSEDCISVAIIWPNFIPKIAMTTLVKQTTLKRKLKKRLCTYEIQWRLPHDRQFLDNR